MKYRAYLFSIFQLQLIVFLKQGDSFILSSILTISMAGNCELESLIEYYSLLERLYLPLHNSLVLKGTLLLLESSHLLNLAIWKREPYLN